VDADCPWYFCPTSGDTEDPTGGGFTVCCDRPDLHIAVCWHQVAMTDGCLKCRRVAYRAVRLDPGKLHAALDQRRRDMGISNRELLRQVGEFGPSAMNRLRQGAQPSADLLVRFLVWLGETDLAPYLSPVSPEPDV
jgi:hypothetical protein